MTWHVDDEAAVRYVERRLDGTSAASVESHLVACDACRSRVNGHVDDELLNSVWVSLTDVIDRPVANPLEQLVRTFGCSETTSRIISATSRARWSFLFAVGVSIALALLAAGSGDDQPFGLVLLVAPLGPLMATATAYGRWSDPASEIAVTTPTPALRILLARTLASVVPAVVLTAVAVPWLAGRGWLAIAWLLPALALCAGALALSSWVGIERAAIACALVWIAPAIVLRVPIERMIGWFAGPAQIMSLVTVAIAGAVVSVRRDQFEHMEAW
jgi:hypothetical protein